MHRGKCQFCIEGIAFSSTCRELHQIVNTLLTSTKSWSTIYPSADIPMLSTRHSNNKVGKVRANVALEPVALITTLATGITTEDFSSVEKLSLSTLKECILNSAPKSRDLGHISSKHMIACLDSILPSFTDLFNSFLASGIFPHSFKIALATPTIKSVFRSQCLQEQQPVSNLCLFAKILEKLIQSQVSSYLNSYNLHSTLQTALRPDNSTETALLKVLKVVDDLFLSPSPFVLITALKLLFLRLLMIYSFPFPPSS